MNKKSRIRIVAMVALALAVLVMALVGWIYRRDRSRYQNIYTQAVKQRDISDTARKALSALQDAELREQGYALTGETAYSEAYAEDIRQCVDEFGTLEVVAKHDPSTTLVRELSDSAGKWSNCQHREWVADERQAHFLANWRREYRHLSPGSRIASEAAIDRDRKG